MTALAQNGLERIIVERYYIADTTDEKASGGTLRAGSVTYRIFIDLLPGYKFQAAYGVPGHPMFFTTSTNFFNDEENGEIFGSEIPYAYLTKKALMLDSWVSSGANSTASYGVLKTDDPTESTQNYDGLLKNSNPQAGIPVKINDGLQAAAPVPGVSVFGIDSTDLVIFKKNKLKVSGQKFYSENGSWFCMGGSIALDTSNKILIAQLTTDGLFNFELNIQIGTPQGEVENYVARKPVDKEIEFPGLIFSSTSTGAVVIGYKR